LIIAVLVAPQGIATSTAQAPREWRATSSKSLTTLAGRVSASYMSVEGVWAA